jgi:polyisoprenoid-binding protein YceI
MKKITFIAAVALATMTLSFTAFEGGNWSSDAGHSRLGFTITHIGITEFYGDFNSYETKLTSSKPDFSDAVVSLSADVNSVDTGIGDRDKHVTSADFLDAEKFPKITFKSTSFKKGSGKDEFNVTGQLSMHGVTKEITLKAKHTGNTINPMSKVETTAFHVTGTFKRSDFGIGASTPSAILSDEINLVADLEMAKD